ncbi:MAG: arylsulfatase [Gemmataceae bacterium]
MRFYVISVFVPFALLLTGSRTQADERPNIVLIMADDMGFSDIGCYGGEIATPHLDKLAGNGLRFAQFYNGARCCPTRAALLTGLYAHQAGMGGMEPDWGVPGYRGNINRKCVTLAEVLKLGGYSTYMVGKWHLTNRTRAKTIEEKFNWPRQRGFDRFYGTIAGAGNFFNPATLTRGNQFIQKEASGNKNYYYTDAISRNACTFIDDHLKKNRKDNPFFLYVAYTAPHWPMHAPKELIKKYRGKYRVGWDVIRKQRFARQQKMGLATKSWKLTQRTGFIPSWNELAERGIPKELQRVPNLKSADDVREMMDRRMAVYAAMVERMDQGIGRIIETLRKGKKLDNTLILFLSDNGGCAEYAVCGFTRGQNLSIEAVGGILSFVSYGGGWANASNTPFRWFKHDTYEGGVATPLIVHWPAGIPEKSNGAFRRQVGHIIDIMPTLVEVAKAKYPKTYSGQTITPMEGVSLVPAFGDEELRRKDNLYWEHHGNRAAFDGRWKLVARGEKAKWELYDLKADRCETTNVVAEHKEIVRRLDQAWWKWAKRANVLPMNPNRKRK